MNLLLQVSIEYASSVAALLSTDIRPEPSSELISFRGMSQSTTLKKQNERLHMNAGQHFVFHRCLVPALCFLAPMARELFD